MILGQRGTDREWFLMLDRFTGYKRLLALAALNGGGASIIERTATGNPLTFLTDLAKPLKSLVIPFSDENGVTGLTVWQAGGNLIDATQLQDGYVWWNGSKISGYAPNCVSPLIPVKAGSTYYRQGRTASQNAISFFDKDKAFLSQSIIQPPASFTVPNGACYAGFTFGKDYKDEAMVNAGLSAMPYEEYKPITEYQTTFPVEAGTPTAGQLDIISGVLTVTAPTAGIYQLTPQQITALVGNNTIWSDADGSMTAVYLLTESFGDDHPISGGLGSGLLGGGFGSGSGEPDEPVEPDEPGDPDEPSEPVEPDQPEEQ